MDAGRLTAMDLLRALRLCNTITRRVGVFSRSYDVLVIPTVATPPPPPRYINQNDKSLDPRGWLNKLFALIPFTTLFNVTGQPAISLPLVQSREGLPIGVQLVAHYGDEATLLRLAAQLEEVLPWAGRYPSSKASPRPSPMHGEGGGLRTWRKSRSVDTGSYL